MPRTASGAIAPRHLPFCCDLQRVKGSCTDIAEDNAHTGKRRRAEIAVRKMARISLFSAGIVTAPQFRSCPDGNGIELRSVSSDEKRYAPEYLISLQGCAKPADACNGHLGQTYCISFALAERICRATDWVYSPQMSEIT